MPQKTEAQSLRMLPVGIEPKFTYIHHLANSVRLIRRKQHCEQSHPMLYRSMKQMLFCQVRITIIVLPEQSKFQVKKHFIGFSGHRRYFYCLSVGRVCQALHCNNIDPFVDRNKQNNNKLSWFRIFTYQLGNTKYKRFFNRHI